MAPHKNTLTYWAQFARETTCFLLGHEWRSSWRPRDDFAQLAALEPEQLTYAQKKSGNHMWEFRAWWHYKCTRCRLKTRDEAWWPWHVTLRWAVAGALRVGKGHLEIIDAHHRESPARVKALLFFSTPVAMIEEFLLHYWDAIPATWWTPFADLTHWVYCKVDEWDTHEGRA